MRAATEDMQAFLDKCKLPTLNQTDCDYLRAEITCREVTEKIKSLKNGKTTRMDGFSTEFYKKLLCISHDFLERIFLVLALDAKKAFDQVGWPYLFAVLKKLEVGDGFISWIKLLYRTPMLKY